MKDSPAGRRKGDDRNRGDDDADGAWRRRIGLQSAAGLRRSSGNGKASYERGSARRSSRRYQLAPETLLAGKSASGPAARLAAPVAAALHEERSGAGQERVGERGANREAVVDFYRARRGRGGDGREQWPSMPWRAAGLDCNKGRGFD
jgi:hypothetical protein